MNQELFIILSLLFRFRAFVSLWLIALSLRPISQLVSVRLLLTTQLSIMRAAFLRRDVCVSLALLFNRLISKTLFRYAQ